MAYLAERGVSAVVDHDIFHADQYRAQRFVNVLCRATLLYCGDHSRCVTSGRGNASTSASGRLAGPSKGKNGWMADASVIMMWIALTG